MSAFADLFTPRQLVALTTFSDLVTEARARVERDAIVAGLPDDSTPLRDGGAGAKAYAEAVAVYLAFALSTRQADYGSTLCHVGLQHREQIRINTFSRQAIPDDLGLRGSQPASAHPATGVAMVDVGMRRRF